MNVTEYQRMEHYEKTYWWHLGRLRIIEKEITRQFNGRNDLKILNIGCGTGGTVKMLEKFGRVENVDVSDEAIQFMKQNGFKHLHKVKGLKLPFKDNHFDMVGAFDVLEHIEKDKDALKEWYRVLKPGGKLILTVPAHQWLWSGHDVSLHHFRRYSRKELKNKFVFAGYAVQKASYAIVFSLPMVTGFRLVNKIKGDKVDSETSYVALPNFINKLFTKFLYAEAAGHAIISYPFGTSLIAVGKKDS